MIIELVIEGKERVFTAPFVPALAKRLYLKSQAKIEEGQKKMKPQELLDESDELYSILSDVVFHRQFTLEQLYAGAETKYIEQKLTEAIWGVAPSNEKPEENELGK